MANTFLTLKEIARQAMPRLIDNLVFPNLVYRDFSEDFHNMGDTVRVRKPVLFEAEDFDAAQGVNFQDIKEDGTHDYDHSGTTIEEDPQFANPAAGDFHISGATQVARKTGDPRWLP